MTAILSGLTKCFFFKAVSFFFSGIFLYFLISYLILYDAIILYMRFNSVYYCLFLSVPVSFFLILSLTFIPVCSCLLKMYEFPFAFKIRTWYMNLCLLLNFLYEIWISIKCNNFLYQIYNPVYSCLFPSILVYSCLFSSVSSSWISSIKYEFLYTWIYHMRSEFLYPWISNLRSEFLF